MGFHVPGRYRLGPVQLNTHNGRPTSVTFRLGRLSFNTRTRRFTVDTPGPGYWRSRRYGRKHR